MSCHVLTHFTQRFVPFNKLKRDLKISLKNIVKIRFTFEFRKSKLMYVTWLTFHLYIAQIEPGHSRTLFLAERYFTVQRIRSPEDDFCNGKKCVLLSFCVKQVSVYLQKKTQRFIFWHFQFCLCIQVEATIDSDFYLKLASFNQPTISKPTVSFSSAFFTEYSRTIFVLISLFKRE